MAYSVKNQNGKNNHQFRHGLHNSPEYKVWEGIIQRCTNPKNCNYPKYGGRGIDVAPEWRNDFLSFYNYIGRKPSAKHSVDRIDNNKGYVPGNVRWATYLEQAHNKRNSLKCEINGVTINSYQFSKITGKRKETLSYRIKKKLPLISENLTLYRAKDLTLIEMPLEHFLKLTR
jgi:hypothetical protein